MSELEVRVPRHRPVCPFCKEEVVHGHVWVCPTCEAPHHTDCVGELGGCASCGPTGPRPETRPRLDPKAATLAQAGDWLARCRQELGRLGLWVSEDGSEARGIPAEPGSPVPRHPWRIRLQAVETLTAERLEADRGSAPGGLRELLTRELGGEPTVWFYRAGQVTPEARAWLERGPGRLGFFAAALLEGDGALILPTRARWLGAALYPAGRFLAHRLAFPELDLEDARRFARPWAWLVPGLVAVLAMTLAVVVAFLAFYTVVKGLP